MSTHEVPASIIAGAHTFDASIDVEAEYCRAFPETRTDPAEPAGYEVFSAKLVIDGNLRARVVDRVSVWVQGSPTPVDVAIDPELLAKADAIDIDDEDLRDELSRFLNNP